MCRERLHTQVSIARPTTSIMGHSAAMFDRRGSVVRPDLRSICRRFFALCVVAASERPQRDIAEALNYLSASIHSGILATIAWYSKIAYLRGGIGHSGKASASIDGMETRCIIRLLSGPPTSVSLLTILPITLAVAWAEINQDVPKGKLRRSMPADAHHGQILKRGG